MPYKTVNSVLQTKDGYVWAATGDGLARFDGVKFTIFNTANSEGLTTNRLRELAETADGSLWISGEESGLFRYRNGEFSSPTAENNLPGDRVFSLFAEKAENRLRILTDKGLSVWKDEIFTADNSFDSSFPVERNFALLDNTGAFCRIKNGVMTRYAPDGIARYKLGDDSPDTLLTLAYQARDGAFWIGTFYRKEPRSATVYMFKNGETSVLTNQNGLPFAFVNRVLEDRKGNVWLAIGSNGESGLARFENGKIRLFGKADGFSGGGVTALLEDREGGIWAATTDNGLTRASERLITSYTRENAGLSTDNIYPLYEDADGEIWAGAWRAGDVKSGGIDKFENGFFRNFAARGQMTSFVPTALFKDRDGNLWIGAYGGATRYKDGKFTQFTKENGFVGEEVYAVTQTGAGDLWFGTEKGLILLRDNAFVNFTASDGLPHNEIKFLHEAKDGTLWIATRGGPASLKDGKFTNYKELPQTQIRSIYEDADGALWFGTYDAGVFRYKNGEYKIIAVKDGLFDNGAFQILEDDFGGFWISSNRGVYRVSRRELNDFADGKIKSVTSIAYGTEDGMANAECNGGTQPAGFKSKRDGTLWFPTQKGIAVINPKALPTGDPPNVVVENCLLDRQKVSCAEVKISPENDSLEIEYTALSFAKSEQIKFKYKLEGLDAEWIEAGTRRVANFTHLPPGDYVFRVAATNAGGVWNETGASLKISVVPPFYRTFWFLSLSVLAFAGSLFVAYRRRVSRLEKARVAQEEFSRKLLASQENERQRIASELHDSLGQELLIIKNWALIGLQNGGNEKTRSQFGEISETASAAIDEVREIAYNLRPYHLDELGLTKAIESMLQRVSAAAPIDFTVEIDQIDGFFQKDAEINFYRIVQESVNNVVKHSGATEADVRIRRGKVAGELRLSVWDNGTGFDASSLTEKVAGQSGFGLAGINERARILGGKLTVSSVPGEGTNVNLTISNSNKQL